MEDQKKTTEAVPPIDKQNDLKKETTGTSKVQQPGATKSELAKTSGSTRNSGESAASSDRKTATVPTRKTRTSRRNTAGNKNITEPKATSTIISRGANETLIPTVTEEKIPIRKRVTRTGRKTANKKPVDRLETEGNTNAETNPESGSKTKSTIKKLKEKSVSDKNEKMKTEKKNAKKAEKKVDKLKKRVKKAKNKNAKKSKIKGLKDKLKKAFKKLKSRRKKLEKAEK